MSYIIVDI